MKIAVIPDTHGRSFWKQVKDIIDSVDHIVFLGDYVDPYGYEGITGADALENFKEIIEFKKANPEKVTLLLGNHDGQYMGWSHTYARYDQARAKEIKETFNENFDLFKITHRINNVLFTHAGVSQTWLEQNKFEFTAENIVEKLTEMFKTWKENYTESAHSCRTEFDFDANPKFAEIGWSRGGFAASGGPTWAHVTDVTRNPAYVDELIQIFGHSQMQDDGMVYHKDNCYMCDSRMMFIWDDELQSLKVYEPNGFTEVTA
ncbi:MAG: metallophosphoesterase [Methanobrevibacter sp.]|nr:metallophosphoesterase [Methanobrevibacter sp.]